jgi:hypothetical protein
MPSDERSTADTFRGASLLRGLPRVDPPDALLPRILGALSETSRRGEPLARPAPGWVTALAAAAALVVLSLGLFGVARAGSREAARDGKTLAADRVLTVVDDPALSGAGLDPFSPLGLLAVRPAGEPDGRP